MTPPASRPTWLRLVAPATAAALVLGGAVTASVTALGTGDRRGDLLATYDRDAAAGQTPREVAREARPHDHTDPDTKNAVSRAGETAERAQDPTSAQEKVAHAAAVAAGRAQAPPRLTSTPAAMPRAVHPPTRYALANGCYPLTDGGEPRYFKPTALGKRFYAKRMDRFTILFPVTVELTRRTAPSTAARRD